MRTGGRQGRGSGDGPEADLIQGGTKNMKLGVIADTHENMPKIASAVELFNHEKVDLVLHAGDFISPITAGEFEKLDAGLVGVFGNNDGETAGLLERYEGIGELHVEPHEMEVGGRKIVLMHLPDCLDALVASGVYDLIVYGHTHRIDVREEPCAVLNPGEACGWITGRCTAALVDLESMSVEVVDLE